MSAIGLGAGPLGLDSVSPADADRLLGTARDLGICLVDTARSYGRSEDRLGRILAGRSDFVVSTKVGYGIDGVLDWTGSAVRLGIEEALSRLGRDCIDIVFLHSCPRQVLERGDVIRALLEAKRAGNIRVAGYSGDNEDLAWAVASGRFDAFQTSVSVWDQASLRMSVPEAYAAGAGIIAKRPLGNAPWRYREAPLGQEAEPMWHRMMEMPLEPGAMTWHEWAVRHSAWHPLVHSAICGTRSPDHLRENVRLALRGPLAADQQHGVEDAFARVGSNWRGRI